MKKLTSKRTNERRNKLTERNELTNERLDRWTDRRMNDQTEKQTDE